MSSTSDEFGPLVWTTPTPKEPSRTKWAVISLVCFLGGIGIWLTFVRNAGAFGLSASGALRWLLIAVAVVLVMAGGYFGFFATVKRRKNVLEFYLNGLAIRGSHPVGFSKYADFKYFYVSVIPDEKAEIHGFRAKVVDGLITAFFVALIALYEGPDTWCDTPKAATYSVLMFTSSHGRGFKCYLTRAEHEALAPVFARTQKPSVNLP